MEPIDFGGSGQSDANFFDPGVATEMSTLQNMPRLNVNWDGGCVGANGQPGGSQFSDFADQAIGYPHIVGDLAYGAIGAAGLGGLDALKSGLTANSNSLLTMAHNSTRAAKNGREQQRAQKISDVIDKLKVGHFGIRFCLCYDMNARTIAVDVGHDVMLQVLKPVGEICTECLSCVVSLIALLFRDAAPTQASHCVHGTRCTLTSSSGLRRDLPYVVLIAPPDVVVFYSVGKSLFTIRTIDLVRQESRPRNPLHMSVYLGQPAPLSGPTRAYC